MGRKTTKAMMTSSQAAIVAKDKKEALEILAPKEIKDEKILNFRGRVIGMVEGAEDRVLNEDEVLEKQSRITQAFVESIFKPLMDLLNVEEDDQVVDEDEEDVEEDAAEEVEEEVEESEEEAPKKKKKKDSPTEEKAENDMAGVEADIEEAITAGKAKKAKKLLKTLDKDHPAYKQYKKSIKKLGE
jgi:hypothetical protein